MKIIMLTQWSPAKGKRLAPGELVDVPDEVAVDMIERGIAAPARVQVERAVGPAQTLTPTLTPGPSPRGRGEE